jgi:DNA-binding response OmpR family regulator
MTDVIEATGIFAGERRLDVLLCDPNEQRGRLTKEFIEAIPGVRCAVLATPSEAVESLEILRPDVVICESHSQGAAISLVQLEGFIRTGHASPQDLPLVILCDSEALPFHRVLEGGATHFLDGGNPGALEILLAQMLHRNPPRPTLLVIEDDHDAAHMYAGALQRDFEVDVEHDGERGLQAWRARRHALVLLDLSLPGLDGRAVLQAIREENPQQVVVVCTLQDTIEDHKDLLRRGAADFVMKTTGVPHLARVCVKVLRRVRTHQAAELGRSQSASLHQVADCVKTALQYQNAGVHSMAGVHLRRAALEAASVPLSEDRQAALLCGLG